MAFAVVFMLFLLIFLVVYLGLLVFYFIGTWKMYSKAGQDGWKSIIPFYNSYVLMTDICDMHIGYFIASISVTVVSLLVSFLSALFMGLEWNVAYYVAEVLAWVILIAGYAVNFAVYYNLGKKFNKKTGWVILTFFFGIVTIPLLGVLKKEVYTDIEVSKHSLFGSIGK